MAALFGCVLETLVWGENFALCTKNYKQYIIFLYYNV